MNQRKLGAILSYVSEGIQVLVSLVYTPLMLRALGQSEYGLYQLVHSVIAYLSLLSLGFSGSYIRYYSRYKVKNDSENIAKLNGMFMTIFGIIASVATICGIILSLNARTIFGSGLTNPELAKAKILLLIMSFNLGITFISTVFSCIVTSQEKFVFQKCVFIAKEICSPLITLPLLLLGYGSISMVLVTTFLNIISLSLNLFYCTKKLQVKFSFHNFDFKLLKEMWIFTFFIFLNQIIDQINWNVDKFLLGRMHGTISVAVYGIASQINTMYLKFSTSICNVFTPKINMMVAEKENDTDSLTNMMIKVGRIQFAILMLILSGFFFFGIEFLRIWAGEKYVGAYYATLLLIGPVTVPLIQNLGIDIQRAKNKHKIRSIVYFFIALINIFISIPLIKKWGITGAALGTAIGLFAGNIIFMNIYYQKSLKLDMIKFWKEIIKYIPSFLIPAIAGFAINKLIIKSTLIFLVLKIIIYTIIYCISIWFIGFNDYEKGLLINPFQRVFKKSNKYKGA